MTNATNSALRLLPGPEPFERAVEAFGRRLAAEGRSPSTISAYLRDLRWLTAVLSERHPGLTPDCALGRPIGDSHELRCQLDFCLKAAPVRPSARSCWATRTCTPSCAFRPACSARKGSRLM